MDLPQTAPDSPRFFCVGPPLDSLLARNGLFARRLVLIIDQNDWPAAGCPKGPATVVVDLNSLVDVGGVTDIEAAVGAVQDVDVKTLR